MKRWIVVVGLIVALIAGAGLYLFYKEPPDIREAESDFELSASELQESYQDELKANGLYLGKVLLVTGVVASVERDNDNATVFLETGDPLTGITCSFYAEEIQTLTGLQPGQTVRIKGECTGKLADIVLNHCSIVK